MGASKLRPLLIFWVRREAGSPVWSAALSVRPGRKWVSLRVHYVASVSSGFGSRNNWRPNSEFGTIECLQRRRCSAADRNSGVGRQCDGHDCERGAVEEQPDRERSDAPIGDNAQEDQLVARVRVLIFRHVEARGSASGALTFSTTSHRLEACAACGGVRRRARMRPCAASRGASLTVAT